MLSLTCKTAIKAVVLLASRYDHGENIGIREIAESIDANEHTVGKLLQILVKHQVIHSIKGPSGGFYISREQLKLPIMRIVDAIDGKGIFRECGLGLSKCSSTHPCPIHNEYKKVRDIMENLCRERRIFELCQPVKGGMAYLTD